MIKRVNFTGRRRIPHNRVDIEVYDGNPRTFDATISLDDLKLLPHAAVFLEAMCARSSVVERVECGEVGALVQPRRQCLREVEGENVFFALKVVDRTKEIGQLLGIAEHIRPERAGTQTIAGRRGILPIEPKELGQQLWKLEFKEHDVFLFVNKSVPGLVERARSDALFFSAVYPEVVRRVLAEAIAENADVEEDDDRWPVMWLRFGKSLHPMREPPPSSDAGDDVGEWIEQVVDAFCKTHALSDKYVAALLNGNGGDA